MGTRFIIAFSFAAIAFLPTPSLRSQESQCLAPALGSADAWLPVTSVPTNLYDKPRSHVEGGGDCPFYKAAWQTFLNVAAPDAVGAPTFASFANISTTFGMSFLSAKSVDQTQAVLLPRSQKNPNEGFQPDGGIEQAGFHSVLIDQSGNPIFYAVHLNPNLAGFFTSNVMASVPGLPASAVRSADPSLKFERGAVELKSAWMIVDSTSPPANYYTLRAKVPRLTVVDSKIKLDAMAPPREVTIALMAVHVVFAMEGHPELIWATFEHVDSSGAADSAPAAKKNSDDTLPDDVIDASRDYPLYKRGTPSKLANVVADDSVIAASFDSKTQTFAAAARASVYRAFPASKKNDLNVDGDIQTLNADLTKQFASVNLPATDMRSNYRLVGAVWLDQPQRDFKLKARFDNPANVTSDDQTGAGIVAGEDRLSSMQMESFTQTDFEHCFRCHDTRGISDLSPPMSPKLMNVSHLPAMYLRTSGQ